MLSLRDALPILMARLFSPYELNPAGLNPLRSILANCVDFDRLSHAPIKLFVTATNVRTGRGRVFRNPDITPDALLASACRSEEHTSELQSLMRISYAVFCLKKKKK